MNKNPNISNLDVDQMERRSYDQDHDAKRVIIVGQIGKYAPAQASEAIEPRIVYVDKPFVVKEIEVKEIEKPTTLIQEKIILVDKPVIVTEIKYIDKPILVKEIEVKEIEKPVVVENLKDLPSWVKLLLVVQVISVLVMVTHNLLR